MLFLHPSANPVAPLAVAFCAALCALSCAVNPVSGRNELVLMSEEREQQIGDEASKQVEAQLGFIQNPAISSYVKAIGAELSAHSDRRDVEYGFEVVDMVEPNAFALPGGYIYVSRGLVALANSEAELASVIGHEIGHVAARHAVQRDARQKSLTLLTLLGSVGAIVAGGNGAAVGATQLLGAGLIASYSREQERQSDQLGQDYAAKSGIDPAGMASFLRSLDRVARLKRGASRLPGFFDSHPATPERFAEATTRADVIRWEAGFAIASTREDYLRKLDGMVVGEAAAGGVFHENIFLHAGLGISQRFPHGWKTRNEASRVIAVAPKGDAIAVLEHQGAGTDPRAAAAEFGRRPGVQLLAGKPVRVGALPAYRAEALVQEGGATVSAYVTWVSLDGTMYRLTAGSRRSGFSKREGVLLSFARGFRPIRQEELESITELRLRVVYANEGEVLSELSARTGNEWGSNETLVMNGLTRPELRAGQVIKIARLEPFAPPAGAPSSQEQTEPPPAPIGPQQ